MTVEEQFIADIESQVKSTPKIPNNPLRIWEYDGKHYLSGLFALHDTYGFPLEMAVIECRERGLIPCLKEFRCDAMKAGWSDDKINRTLAEANIHAVFSY